MTTEQKPAVDPASFTRTERNALLYAEGCVVDYSGLLEGQYMNADDHDAFHKYKEMGLIDYGRIPACMLGTQRGSSQCSHWVTFTPAAWDLAFHFRRYYRATQVSDYRKALDAEVLSRREPVETEKS